MVSAPCGGAPKDIETVLSWAGWLGSGRRQGHKAAAGTRLSSPLMPASATAAGSSRRVARPSTGCSFLQGTGVPGGPGLRAAGDNTGTRPASGCSVCLDPPRLGLGGTRQCPDPIGWSQGGTGCCRDPPGLDQGVPGAVQPPGEIRARHRARHCPGTHVPTESDTHVCTCTQALAPSTHTHTHHTHTRVHTDTYMHTQVRRGGCPPPQQGTLEHLEVTAHGKSHAHAQVHELPPVGGSGVAGRALRPPGLCQAQLGRAPHIFPGKLLWPRGHCSLEQPLRLALLHLPGTWGCSCTRRPAHIALIPAWRACPVPHTP